jgi:NitT/TauT family transport system ATP-binding protein
MEIKAGAFLTLIGPPDCGKSTLLRILARIQQPTSGGVRFDNPRSSTPVVGIVFSEPALLPWRTALENVLIQLELRGLDPGKYVDRARWLLASVGLGEYENSRPSVIPPGMRQRVSLCRAMIHNPSILLLDDPFSNLDSIAREELASEFQMFWMQSGTTAVLATSHVTEAVRLSDTVAVMAPQPGRVVANLRIELPRPRRLDKETTPLIAEYCNSVRNAFRAQGILS